MPISPISAAVASTGEGIWHNHTLPQRYQQLSQRGCRLSRHRKRHRQATGRSSQCLTVCAAGKLWDTGCKLVGCGSSVPEAVLSNKDLEKLVETNDDWIVTRTGIRRRHILGKNESLSDHAAKASQRALDMAGIPADEVDLIILATSSPDDLFGSACKVCSHFLAICIRVHPNITSCPVSCRFRL